jgi:nucleotide-binding universal stress UspA family protein
LELERAPAHEHESRLRDSSPKTILVHLQDDESLSKRIETGLSLARAYRAHLSCLHVTPIEAYVAFDSFGGVFVMNSVIKALDEQEAALKTRVQQLLKNEDVSWDYEQVTGNITNKIVGRGALADLIVTGRTKQRTDFGGSGISFLGELLQRSPTPLFIPGDEGQPCDPTGPALIAWDGSHEAANAVRSAVGMLKLASRVRIIQVSEDKEEAFPSTRLLEYLSRHGVHAELQIEPSGIVGVDQEFISGLLMAEARSLDAAYIVMGGFNHSRIGEYVFGGVTRTMLSGCPVSLVIAD